jgi:membrane protease YdiL (CAAX protease family)
MSVDTKKQLKILGLFLVIYAFLTFVAYALIPTEQFLPTATGTPDTAAPPLQPLFALGAATIVFLLYGALGLAGYWFARRLLLPAVYREGASWGDWVLRPALIGLAAGVILVVGDLTFASAGRPDVTLHPGFPFSLIASATAAIGEEILFRSFVLGSWAFLISLILRRWNGTRLALWLGVVIAALAFSAGHLPAAMVLLGATTPAELPSTVLAEFALLNTFLGVVAGERYIRDGLVAAIGVHFWADIVWHVAWPLLNGGT